MQIISIGREPSNKIVLDNSFVSRRHAELHIYENGQVMIKDLASSNGTFVNGNKISERYLSPGDQLKCAAISINWEEFAFVSPEVIFKPGKAVLNSSPVSGEEESASHQSFHISNNSAKESTEHVDISLKNHLQSSPEPNSQNQPAGVAMQQNVIVMGKSKSVGTAFLLALFFGPLGLLYASVVGGVVMFILAIPIIIFTAFIGIFFINPICSIWAVIAANQANATLQKRAGGLISNNFHR